MRYKSSNRSGGARRALLAAAASLMLVVPAAALAQDHHGGQGGHSGGPGGGGQNGGGWTPGGASNHTGGQGGDRSHGHDNRSGAGPAGVLNGVFRGYDGRDYHAGDSYSGDRRGFGQDLRSAHRFRQGGYRRPEGWYARSWRHGDILPSLFWGRDFWLLDYWLYSLSPPPYGYVWVRDGADAILIDERTGEIEEVIYGVFY
jgi:Ni/Co efflux regulator RcnB